MMSLENYGTIYSAKFTKKARTNYIEMGHSPPQL